MGQEESISWMVDLPEAEMMRVLQEIREHCAVGLGITIPTNTVQGALYKLKESDTEPEWMNDEDHWAFRRVDYGVSASPI